MDVLSGVPERLEPKAYQVLREFVGGCSAVLAIIQALMQTILVMCLEKFAMIAYCSRHDGNIVW